MSAAGTTLWNFPGLLSEKERGTGRVTGRCLGMMFEHAVPLNCIAAWTAWALAVIGAVLRIFVSEDFGTLSLLFAAAGATLHVRGFIHDLERREHAAFNLGRESVRTLR